MSSRDKNLLQLLHIYLLNSSRKIFQRAINYRDAIIGTGILLIAIVAVVKAGHVIANENLNVVNSHKVHHNPKEHHNHERIGFHGMVLISDGTDLFASHLPLYQAPHDFQLLYKVESQYKSQIIAELADLKTVTILPKKFDLNILVDGQPLNISTQVFTGHFERGGKPWLLDNDFEFIKPIYKRALADLPEKANDLMAFDRVNLESGASFYIHQIQARPSFDIIFNGGTCGTSANWPVPKYRAEVLEAIEKMTLPQLNVTKKVKDPLGACKHTQILYFETKDFK